jgi:hypothetical protein
VTELGGDQGSVRTGVAIGGLMMVVGIVLIWRGGSTVAGVDPVFSGLVFATLGAIGVLLSFLLWSISPDRDGGARPHPEPQQPLRSAMRSAERGPHDTKPRREGTRSTDDDQRRT